MWRSQRQNTVRHLYIRTAVSPVLLFRSISQETAPLQAGIQNAGDILRAILLTLGQDTPKSKRNSNGVL